MEAAQRHLRGRARSLSRYFDTAILFAALGMLAFAGFAWPWNLLEMLVPNAYVVTGLAAVTIVANAINAAVKPEQAQLGAVGRERKIVNAEVRANLTRLAVAATAGVTQAFALALSLGAAGIVRVSYLKREVGKIYDHPLEPADDREGAEQESPTPEL